MKIKVKEYIRYRMEDSSIPRKNQELSSTYEFHLSRNQNTVWTESERCKYVERLNLKYAKVCDYETDNQDGAMYYTTTITIDMTKKEHILYELLQPIAKFIGPKH